MSDSDFPRSSDHFRPSRPSFRDNNSFRQPRDNRDFPRDSRDSRPPRDDRDSRPSYNDSRDSFRGPRREFSRNSPPQRKPSFNSIPIVAGPEGSDNWRYPWVELKYFTYNPAVFPRLIRGVSTGAQPGQILHVYDKYGKPFGAGFWNPNSRTPLRMLYHGPDEFTEADLDAALTRAVSLRRDWLELDSRTNAYRLVHGDSDGIGGLIVDRYDDVLSLDVSTLGAWQRLDRWIPLLHDLCGTSRHVISCDPRIAQMEGMTRSSLPESAEVRRVRISENGIKYEVDFESGHKTGFFCDQRENRLKFASLVKGRRVLDLCCYAGGFSLAAKLLGGAAEVTGVDLDEKAIAMAQRNANINQTRVNFVHADAFTYARQMQRNGQTFDAVLLDPPKFVLGREPEDLEEGLKKYQDLNALGLSLVEPGGLFVTCSCSGLVAASQFEELIVKVAQRAGRRLQIIDITGPGADHPFLSTYPEGRYLKVLWAIAL